MTAALPYDDQDWSEDWLETELADDGPPEQVRVDAVAAYRRRWTCVMDRDHITPIGGAS